MDDELNACLVDLLDFFIGNTYQSSANAAGYDLREKYSKITIDRALKFLIDNNYVLGSKDKIDDDLEIFASGVTDDGVKFYQSLKK